MIRLPNIQPTQVGSPTVNPRALAAPAEALGDVAQAIASVGKEFHGIAVQTQRIENARLVSEKRLKLAGDFSAFQVELQKDMDPASRLQKTRDFLGQYKGQFDSEDLAPAVRDQLLQHYDSFAGNAVIRQTEDSANLSVKRAGQQFDNELEDSVRTMDLNRAFTVIDNTVAAGLNTPEEATAKKRAVEMKIQGVQTQQEILRDPKGWMEANPADKVPAGYTPGEWTQQQNFAERRLRDVTMKGTMDIADAMATNQITRPEQIDAMAGDLRPAAVEELKNALARRQAVGFEASRNTPFFRYGVIGQVEAGISSYNPDGPNADLEYSKMLTAIRDLPEGEPMRRVLEDKLDGLRNGRRAEVKDRLDTGIKALNEAWDNGAFGPIPKLEDVPVDNLVRDGLLKDPKKLAELGLGDASKEDSKAWRVMHPVDEKGNAIAKPTDEDRLKAFRGLSDTWWSRTGQTGDPFLEATAEAILNGKGTVGYHSQAERSAIATAKFDSQAKLGKAINDFREWHKVNPDAPQTQVDEKLFEFGGAEAKKARVNGILAPKPVEIQEKDDSTSMRLPFSTDPGYLVSTGTEATVRANARGSLKNPNFNLEQAPLGMRNNNPTNIIFPGEKVARRFGAIGASNNHDAGSNDGKGGTYRQMVFSTPADGMRAGARLALRKYDGGATTASQLIAGSNGWTPGNSEAAANIARTMGLGPNDDLNLDDAGMMEKFLKALTLQEHGTAARQYKDSLFSTTARAVTGA